MSYKFVFMIAGMVSLSHSKPIMVSFGTNQGPITPAAPRTTTPNPLAPRNAAPVYEEEENAPPAPRYQPLTPHQYRKEIYSVRPNPNLILGTPLDIKYTPALEKLNLYNRKAKLEQSEGLGVDYTGPHAFDVQVYEVERAAKRAYQTGSTSSSKYFVDQYRTQKRENPPQNYQNPPQQSQNYQNPPQQSQNYQYNYQFANNRNGFVPQIGIVYSSGVRYYIPQISNEPVENSVYDRNDAKYHYSQQY